MPAALPSKVSAYAKGLEFIEPENLVAVFDRDGFYLYASPNHEQVLGYSPSDLLRMHLSQIVEPSRHHAAWVLRTISVFYSKPIHFSTRLLGKSGQVVTITGTLRHFSERSGERYFVSSVKSVSS